MPTEQQDVVELLKAQHNQIRQLIDRVRAADGAGKREPFEDLVRLLAVHESAEEEVIHPAARRVYVAEHVVGKLTARRGEGQAGPGRTARARGRAPRLRREVRRLRHGRHRPCRA